MTLPKDALPIVSNRPLYLASASPRRLALLEQINITADGVRPAHIDEMPHRGETPQSLAVRLAREKAIYVAAQNDIPENGVILAADTVVSVGRRVLLKPETEDGARACLDLLSGRGHRVQTGLCAVCDGQVHTRLVVTRVRMKVLSRAEKQTYLASDEWQGKAGGYAIQGAAARFITGLVGSYTNIVGLPLYETNSLLSGLDYQG